MATTTPSAAVEFPAGAQACAPAGGAYGGYAEAAVGTPTTSCGFAEAVRQAYGNQPVRNDDVLVTAQSPVTHQTYTMACSGARVVTCTGGNNAVIYLR